LLNIGLPIEGSSNSFKEVSVPNKEASKAGPKSTPINGSIDKSSGKLSI